MADGKKSFIFNVDLYTLRYARFSTLKETNALRLSTVTCTVTLNFGPFFPYLCRVLLAVVGFYDFASYKDFERKSLEELRVVFWFVY